MQSIPSFLKKYFWDVDFKKLDTEKYSYFIIERILEYGNQEATKWLFANFEKSKIKSVLMKKRGLSARSANYWALLLNIPKNKILCLKKSYQKNKKAHWPY